MKAMKKIGSILFCLLPFLLAFGIQLIVSFAAIFLKIFLEISANWDLIMGGAQDSGSAMESAVNAAMASVMDSQFLAGISAAYAVIAAIVLGFWYWKRFCPKKQPRRPASSIINLQMFAGLIFLMAGMQYISNYIIMILAEVNPAWLATYEDLMKTIGFENVTPLLALYSILIAPVSEELIFRGVTMKYAVKCMPFFAANMFQAFLFGLFHANVIQGVYAFVIGLFCGYVCYKGGSIYLSILFHMLFNLWGTFASQSLSYGGNSALLHAAVFFAAVCAAEAGFILYKKGIGKRPDIPSVTGINKCPEHPANTCK